MRFLKKIAILGMALIMITSLAGCRVGRTKDTSQIIHKELSKVKNLSYDTNIDMKFTAEGKKIEGTITRKIDYKSDPLAMKIDINMNMGAQDSTKVTMYAEKADDKYIMYMSSDDTNWVKQSLEDDISQLEQYNIKESIKTYLKAIKGLKEVGTEEINGSKIVKYTGVVFKESMADVIASPALSNEFTNIGITNEQIEAIYNDLDPLIISIWIDNKSSLPVKYEMDMTTIMRKIASKIPSSSGLTYNVEKMFISTTLSNFNKVDKIEIPEVAKNGQEVEF